MSLKTPDSRCTSATTREARRAQALRDNLRRRKQQSRARESPADAAEPAFAPADSHADEASPRRGRT